MKSIRSIFLFVAILTILFYGLGTVVTEAFTNNAYLEEESQDLAVNFNNNLENNINQSTAFDTFSSELSANGTFDNEDVFAIEFFERQSQSSEQQGVIRSIYKFPDLIILALGVPQEDVWVYRTFIITMIGVLIGFALYRAFFGGGRIDDN